MNAQSLETKLKIRKGVRLNHNQSTLVLKIRKGVRLNHNQTALTVK